MSIYKLNANVLCVSPHQEKLLAGITTNTLDAPKNAFVDRFGRIIATMEQIKKSENEMLFVISSHCMQELYMHIKSYLALTKIKIKKIPHNVYFDCDGTYQVNDDEYKIVQRKGQLILSKENKKDTINEEMFTPFRLENNIPLHGIDYKNEMLLNVSEEYVSWTKGCFLGQEVLARVHHLGKPQLKLIVVYADEIEEEQRKKMTSVVFELNTGRRKGFLFVKNVSL